MHKYKITKDQTLVKVLLTHILKIIQDKIQINKFQITPDKTQMIQKLKLKHGYFLNIEKNL